jgi:hypothetical protein
VPVPLREEVQTLLRWGDDKLVFRLVMEWLKGFSVPAGVVQKASRASETPEEPTQTPSA